MHTGPTHDVPYVSYVLLSYVGLCPHTGLELAVLSCKGTLHA